MSDDEISLYFDLRDGERADLEVVAGAALQWVEAVRAAAREIEPSARIRIELLNTSEGSIRLNTILGWIEEQLSRVDEGGSKYWRIKKLAIALAIFVPVSGYPTYQFYFGDKPTAVLSDEDRKRLDELLEQTRKNPEVESRRQKFFKVLERDPSISGAGLAEGHQQAPVVLVPAEQFAERGGLWTVIEDDQDRTTYPIVDVILVSPVLLPSPRAWTFQPLGLPEFTAVMRDKHFLAALEQDHVRERLRIGIPMTVRLEVKEKKVDGAWVIKRGGRSVIEVIAPKVD